MNAAVNPADRAVVTALLRRHNAPPLQRLGQHFLVSRAAVESIVEAAGLTSADEVLEVGPGAGALTVTLAQRAYRVTAVEKDRRMLPVLADVLAAHHLTNVEVVHDDMLEYLASPPERHPRGATSNKKPKPNILVGALPYYLTARFFRIALEESPLTFRRIVVIVQREVADRLSTTPPRMNLLALSIQLFAAPEVLCALPRSAFWPQPNVTSAIVRLTPRHAANQEEIKRLLTLARRAFAGRRKQLRNTLPADLLRSAEIDPRRRAQELSLKEWRRLARWRPGDNE